MKLFGCVAVIVNCAKMRKWSDIWLVFPDGRRRAAGRMAQESNKPFWMVECNIIFSTRLHFPFFFVVRHFWCNFFRWILSILNEESLLRQRRIVISEVQTKKSHCSKEFDFLGNSNGSNITAVGPDPSDQIAQLGCFVVFPIIELANQNFAYFSGAN